MTTAIKKIAIFIPTRDRNHKIERLHKFWFDYTNPSVETDCIIVLDEDNEHTYTRMPGFIYKVVKSNGVRGMTFPLNEAVKHYCDLYECVGFWGDDHCPQTKGWNVEMYNAVNKNMPFSMAYANDLLQCEMLPTEILMDSRFVKHLGGMVPPELQHLYVDDYWMHLGRCLQNIHYLADVIIEHEHYSANKSDADNMYLELNNGTMYSKDCNAYHHVINSQDFADKLHGIQREMRYLKRKTVLVTGGCGFVGRHTCKRFYDMDWNVVCVDNFVSESSICPSKWPKHLLIGNHNDTEYEQFKFIQQSCIEYFKTPTAKNHFNLIVHLAAIVGGRANLENNPIGVAEDLSIDAAMFQWAVTNKPDKVIYFSSSAAYPNKYQHDNEFKQCLSENMISFDSDIGVSDLTYGWCKLTGEYLAKLAHEKHGLNVVCYRPFSGYGEDQNTAYPFINLITKVVNQETDISIWSNAVSDFVYIEDVIDFIMVSMDKINDGTAVNIGTGIGTCFSDLVQLMCNIHNHTATVSVLDDKPKGVYYRVSNNELCNSYGFIPKMSLTDGIKKTIKYLKDGSI